MKNFTKKLITIATGSVMALGMCVGASACASKGRGPNEILLWAGGQWVGSDAENLKAYIRWYNENNDQGLTIDLKIQSDFETTFAASTIGNDGPDLMIWDRFNTPTYASSQNLEPIDDLIERDSIDASKFNSTAYTEMSYKNVQYGLPLDLDLWGIYINMDIVTAYNEANVSNKITCLWNEDDSDKLDWTWDDVLDIAGKLKGFKYNKNGREVTVDNGYDGRNVQEFFIHNYFSTGQEFLVDGKANVNNEQGAATLKYLHKLYQTSGSAANNDELGFVNGNLAMYMRPTYFTSYLKTYASSMNVRYMPQPAYPGEGGDNRGVMGGYGMAIPRPINDSDRTEAWETKKQRCWDFMKDWLYNDTNMRKWAEMSMTIPALISTHASTEVQSNSVLKNAIPFASHYTIRPGVPGWTSVQVSVFNNYVANFCKGALTDEKVSETLATIKRETDTTLSSYGLQDK